MKKKHILILCVILICVLLILLIPRSPVDYDDGGTREYAALAYKVVVWERLYAEISPDGDMRIGTYEKTAVYWFADAHKDIDELWDKEKASPDFYDHIVSDES